MPEDPEMFARSFQQMLDLWVLPEVTRRQQRGECPESFTLRAAQVIFFPDDRPPRVRLNEEVAVKLTVRLKSGVPKPVGAPIYNKDVDEIERLELEDGFDPDCGHITAVGIGNRWRILFDCRYNKALAARHVSAAKEFLSSAEHARTGQHWRAFVDNAFSAAELAAKAILVSLDSRSERTVSRKHDAIHSRLNWMSHLGHVQSQHRDVFNKLAASRANARYLGQKVFVVDQGTAEEYCSGIRGLIAKAESMCAKP